ncbi:MAG: glucose-1-phosphate adenylyltransferase [Anaerolineae bacterium]
MHTLAIVLAGGQGTRLNILSTKRAKPAVPFAGKFRIIDFVLSNCVNSGLYTVGVLTQYRPRSLNDHIQRGQPWDLDRMYGGVHLLQPYLGRAESDWYRGTADAVYQNLDFIDHYNPENVLVLAGDHIYKMNYSWLLSYHEEKRADATVCSLRVRPSEASRFGILTTTGSGRVVHFEEKPKQPKGTLASMGIYCFRTEVLRHWLILDAKDAESTHDFGHDILPRMVTDGASVYAYLFDGYWMDVGTVQAYWEANMQLLVHAPPLDLYDRNWVIHTRSEERPPAKIQAGAVVRRSLISHGCIIEGRVDSSILSPGVYVGPGALVRDSIVMTDSRIEAGATVLRCILDKQVLVAQGCTVGSETDLVVNELFPDSINTGLTLIGKNTRLPAGFRVGANCVVGPDLDESAFAGISALASGKSVAVEPQ